MPNSDDILSRDRDAGVSSNQRRSQPIYRKATEEVKRLKVKRKQITKRIAEPSKTSPNKAKINGTSNDRFVPQMQRGMLPLTNRVTLIAGNELPEFVQQPVQMVSLVPQHESPEIKYVNTAEIEVIDEDEEGDVEYF